MSFHSAPIENPFILVLNKGIRKYRKKVNRILTLQERQDLDKDQTELCSRFDLYNTILSELLNIKEQCMNISVSSSTSSNESDSQMPIIVCAEDTTSPCEVILEPVCKSIESIEPVEPVEPVESVLEEKQTTEREVEKSAEKQKVHKPSPKHPRSPTDDKHRYYRKYTNHRRQQKGEKDADGWEIPKKVVYLNNGNE